jgi:hypothetical protein
MSAQDQHLSDTESESDSDGGMQLDDLDLDRVDGIPYDSDGIPFDSDRNVDGDRPLSDDDAWGVNGNSSNGSDTGILRSFPYKVHLNFPTPYFYHYTTQHLYPRRLTSLQTNTHKGRFSGRAPNPFTTSYNRAGPDGTIEPQTAFEKDARTRSHLRDEKHAALAVLMDNELLVTYALASREVRSPSFLNPAIEMNDQLTSPRQSPKRVVVSWQDI